MATLAPKLPYTHPFAGGFPYRGSQRLPSDPDALTYLAAVAAADGAPVETAVAVAVDDFIKGCKADGIWDSLKASCILCGARTLAGALVPLAGTAPTNNNFVDADYNRETAMKGDGSTKFLDSNRANNADPQDDQHACVYVSALPDTAGGQFIFGSGGVQIGATGQNLGFNIDQVGTRSRSQTGVTNSATVTTGLYGLSRANATQYVARHSGVSFINVQASQSPTTTNIHIFQRNDATPFPTTARVAFYSFGEAIDLALLDARVTALVQRIQSIFRSIDEDGMDRDALAYIRNVEAADGGYLELGVKKAIDQFVRGCKYDGIWDAIKASCILCGARTLAGALTPLAGAAPSNNNFVDADYNRETGLVGDGAMKYLLTGLGYNEVSANDEHLAVYLSVLPGDSQNLIGGGTTTPSSYSRIGYSASQQRYDVQSGVAVAAAGAFSPGLVGVSRSSSTEFSRRQNNTTTISASNSAATRSSTSAKYGVFCLNLSDNPAAGRTTAGMSFYSIGTAISDLALLDSRVTTLVTSIGAAL